MTDDVTPERREICLNAARAVLAASGYAERVAELEAKIRHMQGAAGIPDPLEACRVIIKLGDEALATGRAKEPGR